METFDDSFDCIGNYRPDAPIRKCLSSLNSRNTGMDDVKSFRKSVVTRNCVDISSVGRVLNQRTCKNEQKCRAKVQHDYADYAKITPESIFLEKPRSGRGGVVSPFPEKLYEMLEVADELGFADIVSWCPHGRAFIVRKPKQFASKTMRKYFKHTKFTSFQRQLNLYGFRRITKGTDGGAYYHELFLRGRPDLCKYMLRQKVKGTWCKAANNPDAEPNFYIFPPIDHSQIEKSNYVELDDISAISEPSLSDSVKSSLPLVSPESINDDFVSFSMSVGCGCENENQERRHSLSLSDDGFIQDFPLALMSPFDDTNFGVSLV